MASIELGVPFASGYASYKILDANSNSCNRCPLYCASDKPSCSGTSKGLAVVISQDNGNIQQELLAKGAKCIEP